MRINIAASHRFHLLDLARELHALGHDVRFYSYVPTQRVMAFGLPHGNTRSLFPLMLPFLALLRITRSSDIALRLLNLALDHVMAWFMRPCDVYIALGTVYRSSFSSAKRKFGAVTIMEWGSKHIDEQQRIMGEIPGLKRQHPYFTLRAKQGYAEVDYISVASDHVRLSFEERGVDPRKLLQNPYGVDLSMFGPTTLDETAPYDLLMVGGWSYRKGCDLLAEACRTHGWRLLHVGALVDLPFPDDKGMTHVDPVNQRELKRYYAQARVFVLPSREEGLAMVQLQAVACGLPVVCSGNTGGRDLIPLIDDPKWIIEMKVYQVEELAQCISDSLNLAMTQASPRSYTSNFSNGISWKEYGKRYEACLKKIVPTNA